MIAVIVLEKLINHEMTDALFNGKDDSGNYNIQTIYFESRKEEKRWFQLCNSFTFQKYTNGIFDRVINQNEQYVSDICKISEEYEQVYVLINSSFLEGITVGYVDYMKIKKRCPNVKLILYYIDIIGSKYCRKADFFRKKYPRLFDIVYTSDSQDAKKYGLVFWPLPYVKKESIECIKKEDQEIELFFCANTKKRSRQILQVLEGCRINGVDVSMELLPTNPEEDVFFNYKDQVTILKGFHTYDEMLTKTLRANCILDIVQSGQTALTMRPFEAVCYNKKLLTNNPSIFDFQYYNPRYMQYFDDPKIIDWNWVKEDVVVDYDYQGEFSPVSLYEDITRHFQERVD